MSEEQTDQQDKELKQAVEAVFHTFQQSQHAALAQLKAQPEPVLSPQAFTLVQQRISLLNRTLSELRQFQNFLEDTKRQRDLELAEEERMRERNERVRKHREEARIVEESADTPYTDEQPQEQIEEKSTFDVFALMQGIAAMSEGEIEQFVEMLSASGQMTAYQSAMIKQILLGWGKMPPEQTARLGEMFNSMSSSTQMQDIARTMFGAGGGAFSRSSSFASSPVLNEPEEKRSSAEDVRREEMEQRLAADNERLAQLSKERQSQEWARALYQRGADYLMFSGGTDEALARLAIADFTEVLRIIAPGTLQWAAILQTRGSAYMGIKSGDRKATLGLALADYDRAIEIFSSLQREDLLNPVSLARSVVLMELGEEGSEDSLGKIMEAIAEDTMISSLLPAHEAHRALMNGSRLVQSREGDHEENVRQGIKELSRSMELFEKEHLIIHRAGAQGARGLAYLELKKRDRIANIRLAIADLNEVISIISYEQDANLFAQASMGRASASVGLYNLTQEPVQEQMIGDCEHALRVFSREKNFEAWVTLLQIRCIAYTTRNTGDPVQNCEQALSDANQLLRSLSREKHQRDWALTHLYRGNVYNRRSTGGRRKNLELALADYDAALTIFTQKSYPTEWAQVVTNRNQIVQELGIGVTHQTLEQLVAEYDAALAVLRPEEQPLEWGTVHVNYGNVYLQKGMTTPDRFLNDLAQAQWHYEQALSVFSVEKQPLLWAQVQVNLGIVKRHALPSLFAKYMGSESGHHDLMRAELPEIFSGAQQLRQGAIDALEHFNRALMVFNYDVNPREWAVGHRERAFAHRYLTLHPSLSSEEKKKHFLSAQEDFSEAMKVITKDGSPLEWAILHMDRGIMYQSGIVDTPRVDALSALADFQAALEVYAPEVMPANYRRTQLARSLMLERLENWQEAHEALLEARKVQRDLVASAMSDQGSLDAIADFSLTDIYLRDAQILLRLEPQDLAEAAIALEEGRAQNMRMALDLDSIDSSKISNPVARERMDTFLAARKRWRKQQHALVDLLPTTSSFERNELQRQHFKLLREAYEAFLAAREAIRKHDDPDFMTPVPTLEGIAKSVSAPGEALVYLAVSSHRAIGLDPLTADGSEGGLALVVLRSFDGEVHLRYLSLPCLTSNAISALLTQTAKDKLPIHLERTLRSFGEFGLNDLSYLLLQEKVLKVTFVTYGRLSLFPLSAVPVRVPPSRTMRLGELFEISFAPSARAAEIAKVRTREITRLRSRQSLLLIGNPLPTPKEFQALPYTEAEIENIEIIAKEHNYSSRQLVVLLKEQATKQNVLEQLPKAKYVHMATHGLYVTENPRSSHLILAGDERVPAAQRTITLGEALDGNISLAGIQLLVLSACETSLIDIQKVPNEVIGLAAGFLQAGVAGIIASLWPVDDRASSALMIRFAELYLNQQNTWSPARALAEAQRWLREEATNRIINGGDGESVIRSSSTRSSDPGQAFQDEDPDALPFADPRYWAAFIVTGS